MKPSEKPTRSAPAELPAPAKLPALPAAPTAGRLPPSAQHVAMPTAPLPPASVPASADGPEAQLSLTRVFEEAPPLRRWRFCAESIYHLQPGPAPFLHYHREMEVGLCVSGTGMLLLDGKSIPFATGDVQVVLPMQPHYNVSDQPDTVWHFISFTPGRLESTHIHLDPGLLDTLARDCKTSGVFTAAQDPDLVRLLTSLALSAVRNPVSPYDEDRLLLLLLDVLLKLGTLGSDLPAPSRADLPTDKIMPALILLSDAIRAGRPVSIADMAEACHFSQSHFRKLFLEAMGTSPKDYMIQEQLKFAAQLLRTTAAPIAQIQQRTGFVDGSVFFRNFVRKYNCSPSAFRKASRTEKAGK